MKDNLKIRVTPIKSQGKKTKLVEWINEALKTIEKNKDYLYIEPFVGTGAVGFNIAPKKAIFADINPHLINFYNDLKEDKINHKIVRDFLNEEGVKLLDKGGDYYYEVRKRFNESPNSLDFLFITRSCFNGMMRFNKKGGFNVPFCKKPQRFSKSYITKIVNEVHWLETKIKNNDWSFYISDFKFILDKYKNNPDVIYYLDAPYVLRHSDYFNGWAEKEEMELYEGLLIQKGQFILSTWHGNDYRKNPFIETIWNNFELLQKNHTYHVGAKVENRNEIIETLVIKSNL